MYQMAPLNWMQLMIYFIAIFMMFNTINYFFIEKFQPKTKDNIKSNINWNW